MLLSLREEHLLKSFSAVVNELRYGKGLLMPLGYNTTKVKGGKRLRHSSTGKRNKSLNGIIQAAFT